MRREVARATLERLFSDGRIHPARIEEMVVKARNELAQQIKREGEQACQDIGLTNVHPELARLLGTLRYRHSYGHNVLAHSQDTAALAGMIAVEIGFDEQVAKEAALFHDIGKAVEHEVDGPHAIIGGETLARLGTSTGSGAGGALASLRRGTAFAGGIHPHDCGRDQRRATGCARIARILHQAPRTHRGDRQ